MNEAARIMGVSPTQAKGAKQRYGINNGRKGSEGLCRHDIRMLRAADGAGTRAEREAIGRKYGMSAEAVRMAVTRWRRHGRPVPVVTDGR